MNKLSSQAQKHSFSFETTLDNYKESKNFNNKNQAFATACNTTGYHFGLNYAYLLPQNWVIGSKLGWGMQNHRFNYEFDWQTVSDYLFKNERDMFATIVVSVQCPYTSLNLSIAKRFDLPENWFVDLSIGLDVRVYLMNTGFVYPREETFRYQNQDTTFTVKYARAEMLFKGGLNNTQFLYTGELKIGQFWRKRHALYIYLGFKHSVGLQQAQQKAEFQFYKNNTQLIGSSTYYNSLQQLNFGLGYQMSF